LSKSVQLDQEVLDSCKLVHTAWNELTRTWTFPTIHSLGLKEPARFNELKKRIGEISATSLAERLTQLEKLGIVQRKVYPETPPKVEYSLTPKGHELLEVLKELADWVERWARKEPTSKEFVIPK